jgi:hypothetical protein
MISVDLKQANLRQANLSNTDLFTAELGGAQYDVDTIWPPSFDPEAAGAIKE